MKLLTVIENLSWHSVKVEVAPANSFESARPLMSKLSKSSLKKHTPVKKEQTESNYIVLKSKFNKAEITL